MKLMIAAIAMMLTAGCANDPQCYQAAEYLAAGCQGFVQGYNNAPRNNIPTFIPPNIQGPIIIPQPVQYQPIPVSY